MRKTPSTQQDAKHEHQINETRGQKASGHVSGLRRRDRQALSLLPQSHQNRAAGEAILRLAAITHPAN